MSNINVEKLIARKQFVNNVVARLFADNGLDESKIPIPSDHFIKEQVSNRRKGSKPTVIEYIIHDPKVSNEEIYDRAGQAIRLLDDNGIMPISHYNRDNDDHTIAHIEIMVREPSISGVRNLAKAQGYTKGKEAADTPFDLPISYANDAELVAKKQWANELIAKVLERGKIADKIIAKSADDIAGEVALPDTEMPVTSLSYEAASPRDLATAKEHLAQQHVESTIDEKANRLVVDITDDNLHSLQVFADMYLEGKSAVVGSSPAQLPLKKLCAKGKASG